MTGWRNIVVFSACCFLVGCGGKGGPSHWEPSYDIDVVDVQTRDSGGIVIYERNGETCAAAQAPDGVLIDIGCNEVGEGDRK